MLAGEGRDISSTHAGLLQVVFFVETFNAMCAERVKRMGGRGQRGGPREGEGVEVSSQQVLLELASSVDRREFRWTEQPGVVGLALKWGLQPPPQYDVLAKVARRMFAPAGVERVKSRIPGESDLRLVGETNLPPVPRAVSIGNDLRIYATAGGGYDLATVEIPGLALMELRRSARSMYCDEVLDPIAVLRDYLTHVANIRPSAVDHFVQAWLRSEFGIVYTKISKYALNEMCAVFNTIFYGHERPSREVIHSRRAATVGIGVLLDRIRSITARTIQGGSAREVERGSALRALGLYYCLRFCEVLRVRTHWLEKADGETRVAGGQRVESERVLRNEGKTRGCGTALRPLEYGYFQNRVFGDIPGIPGLSYIFRGGLLPYTERGRTVVINGPPGSGKTLFALHAMADAAYRGRLAVYFAFEQSRAVLHDQLLSLGLLDPEKFDVIEGAIRTESGDLGDRVGKGGEDLAEEIARRRSDSPRRGLLILYGSTSTERDMFELDVAISELARVAGQDWPSRALSIDSINALAFTAEARATDDSRRRRLRLNLRRLIDVIEENEFWGIIISEAGEGHEDGEFEKLAYLVDTVAELGSDRPGRWIEVMKSRPQAYHTGRHPFRISSTEGVRIYPSLSAVRSSLRKRVKSTLSEERAIEWPGSVDVSGNSRNVLAGSERDGKELRGIKEAGIKEKSSVLICGASGSEGTRVALDLVTARGRGDQAAGGPRSLLYVTFRTSDVRFNQLLRTDARVRARWESVRRARVRWYSPGGNLTAEQFLSELRDLIRQGRQEGVPIERLVFDEVDAVDETLPAVAGDGLFWPTLLELVTTEPVTTFFVVGETQAHPQAMRVLQASADYILRIERGEERTRLAVRIEKLPEDAFVRRHGGKLSGSKPRIETKFGTPALYTPEQLSARISARARALEEEHCQVSVLFAEFTVWSQFPTAAGDDAGATVVEEVLERALAVVHRNGGFAATVTDEYIMAVFGAPLKDSEHALQACRAALEVRDEMRRYQDMRTGEPRITIHTRAGLNSGEIKMMGIRNDLRLEYESIGETVELAARMKETARPGSILMTAGLKELVGSHFSARLIERMHVKDVDEEVGIYELVGLIGAGA